MQRLTENPNFIADREIIISSSYRKNLADVRRASYLFASQGLSVYPDHEQIEVIVDDHFVFLGGVQQEYDKRDIQQNFFRAIKKAKLLYVVTSDGYLGPTASVETAYGLAVNTPTILSEPIKRYGKYVQPETIEILEKYPIGIISIEEIYNAGKSGLLSDQNLPKPAILSESERRRLFFTITATLRELH